MFSAIAFGRSEQHRNVSGIYFGAEHYSLRRPQDDRLGSTSAVTAYSRRPFNAGLI